MRTVTMCPFMMVCILTFGHSACMTDRLGKSVLLNLIILLCLIQLGHMICIVTHPQCCVLPDVAYKMTVMVSFTDYSSL